MCISLHFPLSSSSSHLLHLRYFLARPPLWPIDPDRCGEVCEAALVSCYSQPQSLRIGLTKETS